MSTGEDSRNSPKSSILNYVENFIEKRERELGSGTDEETGTPLTRRVDRNAIVINRSAEEFPKSNLDNLTSAPTDIDDDDLNLEADPVVETREGGEQVYKQQVYLRQYQPPTPEPVDIQVQEVPIKPKPQRPPIHVHVGPNQNRNSPRTPSPIVIRSAPPPPPLPLSSSDEPLVFSKFIPIDYKQGPQQIIIHRYPELPPKPRPIVVEQWLPNKPAPKRITYRPVNHEEFLQDEAQRQRNRFIEYKKPHTTIEVEVVRLPITKMNPEEYHNQADNLTQLDNIRSLTRDPNTLQWRI